MKLLLKPGPKLILKKWHYDEATDEGGWVEEDVTNKWQRFLFWPACELEGATLKDCLLLMNSDLDFSTTVFNNYIEDLIDEGLQSGETDLDYIELSVYKELGEEGIEDIPFPSVHGIGPYGDDVVSWCIMYTPVNKLAGLEIKVGKWSVYDAIEMRKCYVTASSFPVSLGQILYALVWEMSWFGTPEHRDEHAKALDEKHEEVIEGVDR